MKNKDVVTLGSIAKKIYQYENTKQEYVDFRSEITKRYREFMKLLNLDIEDYKNKEKNEYEIPKSVEPIFLYVLKEFRKNKVLKNMRKKRSKDNEVTEDTIKFIYSTEMLTIEEKKNALFELVTLNKNLFNYMSNVILNDIELEIDEIRESLNYTAKNCFKFINFQERIMLLIIYSLKMKDLLKELDAVKDILDADNISLIEKIDNENISEHTNLISYSDIEKKVKKAIEEVEKLNNCQESKLTQEQIDHLNKLMDKEEIFKQFKKYKK